MVAPCETPSGSLDDAAVARLLDLARRVRIEVIGAVAHAQGGHLGGPLSAAELLVTLYFHVLRVRPDEPGWPDRDRFILSKGHSAIALYATLALRGYLPIEELATYDALDSRLQGHPDMRLLPGLDMSTGSLGLGLSAGVGMALGLARRESPSKVMVLLGDGECQEGSVWEAANLASRLGLGNLTAIVDHNRLQQYGWAAVAPDAIADRAAPFAPGVLMDRFRAFGWRVAEADGHDPWSITGAIAEARGDGRLPGVVIAHTHKGYGVPFMQDSYVWHAKVPSVEQAEQAVRALGDGAAS